jgi:hypothetical protein
MAVLTVVVLVAVQAAVLRHPGCPAVRRYALRSDPQSA